MKRAVIALLIIAGAGAGAWVYYVRRAATRNRRGHLAHHARRYRRCGEHDRYPAGCHDGADRQSGVGEHLVPGR